ncbi:MAG: tape measure protein [Sulfurovaceae bacterium]|nr:tape measure protein [Sulfurovaceae bacterium]
MASVGTVVIEVDANIAKLVEGMKKSQSQLSNLQRTAMQAKDTIANFAKAAAGLWVVKQGIDLATAAVASFVDTAAQFEQFETTLTSITGSSEQAKQSMKWIQDFAAQTPFNIDKVTEAFVKMKAYGLDPQDGTLKALGNTAAAMGKDIVDAVEAMADAVTGENERLKEFGIKASQAGQKVAYSWADSSGKMRNISIANNKDIIQSTLTAIFNEKYAGAMEAQSKTWKGMVSNLEDTWTIFKKDVMNEGLFTYLKGILATFGDYLKNGFDGAKNGAASMSDSIISGIKSIILAVGNMYDAWNGIKLAFASVALAFGALQAPFVAVINVMVKAWDFLGTSMQNIFKDAINHILNNMNPLIAVTNLIIKGLNAAGLSSAKPISIDTSKYIDFGASAAKTYATEYKATMVDLSQFVKSTYADVEKAIGKNTALKVISDIDKKIKEMSKPQNSFEAQKEAAKAALDALGAGYGALGNAAQGAGKKGSAAAKEHEKALKDAAKAAEELAAKQKEAYYDYLEVTGKKAEVAMAKAMDQYDKYSSLLPNDKIRKEYFDGLVKNAKEAADKIKLDFTDQFKGLFENLFKGDMSGAIKGFFDGVSMDLMKGMIDNLSKSFQSSISSIFGGLGDMGSGLVGLALGLASKLFSSHVTQAQIDAAKGKSDFSDASIKNLGSMFANVQYPMLEVTNKMYKNIRNMDNNFQSVARAITGNASASGIDLTGANFVNTATSGFLGFSSKTVSLIGTGLKFELQNLTDMMDMASLSVKGYTSKLVESSSFWGLFSSSKIQTSLTNLPDSVKKDISSVFASGYQNIMTAGVALGFNETNIADALAKAQLNIGKIDFTGLSSAEVSERFSQAVSGAFSGVINGISMFTGLVDRYATSSEASLETLVRIATEYDQATHSFNLIGKNFIDGINGFNKQMQVLDIVKSTGGLTNFSDAMGSFMSNFYTDAEQLKFMQSSIGTAFQTLGLSTVPTTNSEFRKLLETMDTSTESGAYLYGQVLMLSDSFSKMTSASDNLKTALSGSLQSVIDTITGDLSAFTLSQKADFTSQYYDLARQSNGALSSLDAAKAQAEMKLKTVATREDYYQFIDTYKKEIEKQAKDASNTDLLNAINKLITTVETSSNKQIQTMIGIA